MIKKILFINIILFISIFSANSQNWEVFNNDMIQYFNNGNLSSAIYMGEKAVKILEKNETNKANYVAVLNNLAYIYFENKNYFKAKKSYNEVLEIVESTLGKNDKITAQIKNYLGEIYLVTLEYNKAEKFLKEAKRVREKILSKNDPDLIQSFRNMRNLCVAGNNYEKAFKYQDTIINRNYKKYGEYSSVYLNSIGEKALIHKAQGNFKIASEMLDSVIIKEGKLSGEYSKIYLKYMKKAACIYMSLNKYNKAIKILQKTCKNIIVKYKKKLKYANCKNMLGVAFLKTKKYEKAMNCFEEAEKIIKKISGIQNTEYASVINNKAIWYYSKEYYIQAESLFLQVKKIIKSVLGKQHYEYANVLNKLALIYYEKGKYIKAKSLFLQALKIYENVNTENKPEFLQIIINIAKYYENTGWYNKAEKYYLKALNTAKKNSGTSITDYVKLLNETADYFVSTGKYKKADSLYNQSEKILIDSVGAKNPEYVITLDKLGKFYLTTYKYKKAQKIMFHSSNIQSEIYGKNHINYIISLNNLASLYASYSNEKENSEKYMTEVNTNLKNYMNNIFAYMTDFEKEAFNISGNYLFDMNYSFFYKKGLEKQKYTESFYNLFLLRKYMATQPEKKLKRKIKASKDLALNINFSEYTNIKQKIAKIYLSPEITNKNQVKKLEEKAKLIETKLMNKSPAFRKYKSLKSTDWQKIKKKLKRKEAVIEFVNFEYYNPEKTDSIFYVAFILRPEYRKPKMIFLFEEKQMSNIIENTNFNESKEEINKLYEKNKTQNLYNLIWKPLEKHLQNVNALYISPSGKLQKISFAALSVTDSTYLSEKYILNMISSPVQFFQNKKEYTKNLSASIYGNIDYEEVPEISQDIIPVENSTKSKLLNDKNYLQNINTEHRQWNNIEGAFHETEIINKLLINNKIKIFYYKNSEASEESIKQYSEDKKSSYIIHISTNNFFFPQKKSRFENLNFRCGMKNFKSIHNPMKRTGLLFSGANITWNDEEMPPEINEDGILTASEISKLNLDSTEIVVISVSETKNKSRNSGVYNLQKAFKTAGAEYIITTLWEVPNNQKTDFIETFYKYKTRGFKTSEAFRTTQNRMKTKYLPYYWAAFVLTKIN